MNKRVFIIHGYKGRPDTNWKPWLKNELLKNGIEAVIPAMPHTNYPIAREWEEAIDRAVNSPDKGTFFVGHSLGCISILRYLESLPVDTKVGGCVFVAGFSQPFNSYTGGHDSFFDHSLDWEKILSHCDAFTVIHSKDDSSVELRQQKLLCLGLNAEAVTFKDKGHFGSGDNVFEVPEVRDELYKIMELYNG